MRKRHLLNRKRHTYKATRIDQNRQIIPDRTPLSTCSIISCDTFTEIEKHQALVVMPLEKSLLAANGLAMLMKGKFVIQFAFDVEYFCVIEHTVHVSDSPEARMNIPGMDF